MAHSALCVRLRTVTHAARKPGFWQTYDVVWTAPPFAADGTLLSPARVAVFHNGELVQYNFALTGDWRPFTPNVATATLTTLAGRGIH